MRDNRGLRGIGRWIILVVFLLAVYGVFTDFADTLTTGTYSGLVTAIKENAVEQISISDNTATVSVNDDFALKSEDGTVISNTYTVRLPSVEALHRDVGGEIMRQIDEGTLIYSVSKPKTPWLNIILPIGGTVLCLIVLIFVLNKNFNRNADFTKNRAKMYIDSEKKVTFKNVAGAVEEKEDLSEIVDFLKNPEKFISLGARVPKGVLLVGPPGTGKTLLAKSVAGEAGVPFFSISGSDFVELYVGVGASRVRDLFEQAKRSRPCIIFIDEIDAVGRKRGAGMGGGHDEREQTLNQLLVEMDGFGTNEGIIMMAATNRPDILDPALLRPGRFDRQVVVDAPDMKGREEILKIHSANKPLSEEVSLEKIARVTIGYTGADLENLMNEAAIFAARRNKTKIDNTDIDDANLKVMIGTARKSRVITDKERRLTAYHEAGHAVLTKLSDREAKIHQISIIPRGRTGGFTMHLPKDDNSYQSKTEMLNEILVLLGGRAAEELVLDDISTGASNDIKRATELARGMVTKYGMSDKLGPVCYDSGDEVFIGRDYGHSKQISDKTASEIDECVKEIIESSYSSAVKMLSEGAELLHKTAEALLEKETLTGEEFEKIIQAQLPSAL